MYYKLNPEVVFKINKNKTAGCFYNLIEKKKISVPTEYIGICNDLITQGKDTNNICISNEILLNFIKYLDENKIGSWYDNDVYIQKINTILPFLLTKERMYSFKLPRLALEVTGDCNLNCSFCSSENIIYRSCGCKKWESFDVLTLNDYYSIINESILFGVKQIVFTGGEPLLKWDLVNELINYIKNINKDIDIRIQTNGTLITSEIAEVLKYNHIHVLLQVLGNDKFAYCKHCGDGNLYAKVKNSVNLLKEFKISTTIKILVTKENENNIPKIEKYYSSLFTHVVKNYLFPPNEFQSKKFYNESVNCDNFEYPVDIYNYQLFEKKNNCLFGQLLVSNSGNVYPCMMIRDSLGNICEKKLFEIIKGGGHLKYWNLPKKNIQHCNECENSLFCFDCRAINLFSTNQINGMRYCSKIIDNS